MGVDVGESNERAGRGNGADRETSMSTRSSDLSSGEIVNARGRATHPIECVLCVHERRSQLYKQTCETEARDSRWKAIEEV